MDIRVIAIVAGAALGASGCDVLSKGCTLVGCEDSFTATVRKADRSFPGGVHRIEVLADSASLTCTFVYPATGGSSQLCDANLSVMVWPETTCTDTTTDAGVTHQCDLVPTRLYETIALRGTPGQVHVWQSVDDTPILDAVTAALLQGGRAQRTRMRADLPPGDGVVDVRVTDV